MTNQQRLGPQEKKEQFDAIERNLRMLVEPGQIHEIRVLGAMGRNRIDAGYFDDPALAARAIMPYDGRAKGIYLTINPTHPDLLARAANRIAPYAKETTRDQEIVKRNWLLIDLDPKRPGGISSSQEEHQAALDQAKSCREWLRRRGWPDPILADSGNGAHLLYKVELPNDKDATNLIKACLRAIQAELSTEAVEIDTSVYNAGQLTKLYGTMVCKGENLPERPHRRSEILEAPEERRGAPHQLLESLAARDPGKAILYQGGPGGGAELRSSAHQMTGSTTCHDAYARQALMNEVAEVRSAPDHRRNIQLNKSAYSLGQLVGAGVLDEQQVQTELQTAAEEAGLAPSEIAATIRSGLKAGMKEPRMLPEPKLSKVVTNGSGKVTSPSAVPTEEGMQEQTSHGTEDNVLDTLRSRLAGLSHSENGKPDRSQLEATALSLIEAATQLTQADLLRLQSDLKQLGATTKFADEFGRAVRDERRRLAVQQIEVDEPALPEGYPYAAAHGQTFLLGMQTDEKGNKEIVRRDTIAEFQAQIVEEAVTEEGRRIFVLEGHTVEGMPFRLEIGAAEFSDERALKAALTSAAGAHAPVHAGMMRHVGPALQQLSDPDIPSVRLYERTGWAQNHFLIPGREPEGVRVALPSKLPYDLSTGDPGLGLDCLRLTFEAVQPEVLTPVLSLILEAAMARLARWQDERYAVFIRGITGSMKTTVAKHLMCLYGRRFQEDATLTKWGEGATRNALMKLASHACDVPLLVDNYKPSTGGGGKDFVNFIHNVVEGGDKERLNRSSQLRETRPLNCWPVITGEDIPDGDPASLARVLVVTFRQTTVDPAKLAEAQALADHLPVIGSAWIEWLEIGEGARYAKWAGEQFFVKRQKWASHLLRIEPDAINRMRVASNLASNQLTLQVASYHPVLGPVIRPYIPQHQAGLTLIAEEMAHSTGSGLEAQRFLSALRQLVASGRCMLMGLTDEDPPPPDRMLGWRKADGIYILPDLARQAVAKVLGDDFFSALSAATLYKQLAELGMIASSDAGRHTKLIRQNGTRPTTLHLKWEALFPEEGSDEELGQAL